MESLTDYGRGILRFAAPYERGHSDDSSPQNA